MIVTQNLATIQNANMVSAYYSTGDQLNNVIVATRDGIIHHLSWSGQNTPTDVIQPIVFDPNGIASLSGYYSVDDQRHIKQIATTGEK